MQATSSFDAHLPASPTIQTTTNPIAPVLSTGDWILTLIVLSIPFVNIPIMLYWALSSSGNPNRKNFSKAFVLIMLLGLMLAFLLGGVLASAQV